MSDPRHVRERELFLAVCEQPETERSSYLDRHCADDPSMRREIESLLRYHALSATRSQGAPPPAVPGTVVGRFEVAGPLGEGGMGEVFLAHDPRLDRKVALKALPRERSADPRARRRLEVEAQALAALNHPNVAAVHELTEVDSRLYLVLEHVPGETLAARLARGPLSVDETLGVGTQIAAGLEAAHAAGVVHRDLKPSNVMLTPDGQAKVLDFGLARRRGAPGSGADRPSTLTAPGVILGTPAYMSPEQARGQTTDATTDLWSFGCVLFECLTGERAFRGDTLSDAIARILEGEPPWEQLPAGLPSGLERLLRRCLTKDRRRRLQHPGDARIELEDLVTQGHSTVDRAGAAVTRQDRRQRILGITGLMAAAALAGFLVARFGTFTRAEPAAATEERRLSIRTPEDRPVATRQISPALALSPDGRHLVWVAPSSDDSTTHLVHRQLDRFEITPLPGTEGASGPFFSPDGTWVGFFAAGELRKVPRGGGTPAVVTEARNPYGAVWTADGLIHFSDAEGSELVSVRDDGRDQRIRGLGRRLVWPQALPGEHGLLVSTPVSVLDPDTGAVTVLTEGSFARYLDTGHLLYRHERNLLIAPFDLETLRLGGSPVAVLEDARPAAYGMHLAVARGGLVAYVAGPEGLDRSFVWAADGQVEPLPAFDTYRTFGAFALSPDGRSVVVELRPDRPDIWVFDLASGAGTRLTRGGNHRWPLWSADGSEVLACWFDGQRGRIVALSPDGSGTPRRPFGDTPGCPIAVSPDGRWLLSSVTSVETGWNIYRARLDIDDTPRPWIATDAFEWGGSFSPDGRWFAYSSDVTGRYEILVTRFPQGDPSWAATTTGGSEPLWTHDGRALVYHHAGQWFELPVEIENETPRFGTPTLLVEGNFFDPQGYSFALSPEDGRLLLLRTQGGDRPTEIRVVSNWVP